MGISNSRTEIECMPRTAKPVILAAMVAAALLSARPVAAKSVKDFDAMTPKDQGNYLVDFLDEMTGDISRKNPDLAKNIRYFFFHKDKGAMFSEGFEKVFIELLAAEKSAREGKADLSKIQVESIVVWVVRQKFPPPWKDETRTARH